MGAHELACVGLAGSGLGTALGVPLIWPRSRPVDVRLLGAAVILMSAIAALISARLAGLAPDSHAVEHAINVLGLCTFPALLLYTRFATSAPITARVTFGCMAPLAVYVMVLTVRAATGLDTGVPFIWMLPVVLGFTAASAVTIWKHGAAKRRGLVSAESVLAFAVFVNAAQIVRMNFGHVPLVRGLVPMVLTAGFLAATAYLAWRTATPVVRTDDADSSPRYERSGLDGSLAPELLNRIDEALRRDRLFARADLTLAQLAAAAGLTSHQVSEALNRYAGISFHDLVNRRRVEDVKAQLSDASSDRFTIEGIGASAGFGSRSALYAAFRRFEGTTPRGRRKN